MLSVRPAEAYRGTFAPSATLGSTLPPGWEGVYFPFDEPLSSLRPDGSPIGSRDEPIRRYVGEDTVFHAPLRFGDEVTYSSVEGAVTEKTGRSGRLVFADLIRTYSVGDTVAVESVWHDVFLPSAGRARPSPAPLSEALWTESVVLDERQLFRFSALTFNTHRIHYDKEWARTQEGLDDLLVHGPLTRILLLDAALRHHRGDPAVFEFRALAPITVGTPITIAALPSSQVIAADPDGGLLARGSVTWKDPS